VLGSPISGVLVEVAELEAVEFEDVVGVAVADHVEVVEVGVAFAANPGLS
jgi:hypothetical protein